MAIEIGNMDYARGEKAIDKALKDITDRMWKVLNAIDRAKSKEYKEFVKSLDKCWIGADRDRFVTDLGAQLGAIYEEIYNFKQSIETVFEDDVKQFLQFQSNNDIVNK